MTGDQDTTNGVPDGTERVHPEDPAEGGAAGPVGGPVDDPGAGQTPHPQDPAEGADDPEVTGG